MRWVEHKEIDKKKWDEAVHKDPQARFYSLSWYLDEVAGSWGAVIDGDYDFVFPVPVKSKLGIRYSLTPNFIQQLDLVSREDYSFSEVRFWEIIKKKARYFDLQIAARHSFESTKVEQLWRDNYELDDTSQMALSSNHRRNVKKAEKEELVLKTSFSFVDEIIQDFRDSKGGQVGHWDEKEYLSLKRLISKCNENNMLTVAGVFKDTMLMCGAFLIHFNGRTTFLFSGTKSEARNTGAMHFLLAEMIKKSPMPTFDFEGSDDENLARFYQGFGGKLKPYLRVKDKRLQRIISKVKK